MHSNERRSPQAPLRVLVVEDSAFFRAQLVRLLTADGDIEVVGQASNGLEAVAQAKALQPDLITMDVEMPVMDGISAVREIMRATPTRIVMLSSLTREGADATLNALEAGALDFIQKRAITADTLATVGQSVRGRVRELVRSGRPLGARAAREASTTGDAAKAASPRQAAPEARTGLGRDLAPRAAPSPLGAGLSRAAEVPSVRPANETSFFANCPLLVLGASTGGPVALGELLGALPASFPCPVLVAVHIPGNFSRSFAERLGGRCAWAVEEATSGARLATGKVLVAPGGMQTRVVRLGTGLGVEVEQGAGELLYRPSLDFLLDSVATAAGRGALAVILTGMGNDGTQGARAVKAAGGTIWAQDEASSVVFGMPSSVIKAGLTSDVLSLQDLAARIGRGR